MNFRDLRGMYRSVICRCIDIIAMNEGELGETGHHVKSEILIQAMDSFGIVGSDTPLTEILCLEDWQEEVIEKLERILTSLSKTDRDVTEHYKNQQKD